ncbi:MAG: hypothetical protein KA914_13100 [Ottowia sp.]|nr:hypothetical protein [Ottowia sp.]
MKLSLSRARVALALAAAVGASQANADLLNISTTVLQSQRANAIACTIVGTSGNTWRGMKVLQIMAEAHEAGANPIIVAEYLENGETMANDNWTGPWLSNNVPQPAPGAALLNALLRTPAGANDSALVVSIPAGWRMCVRSGEVSGGDTLRKVQVAVTDVTDAAIRYVGGTKDHPAYAPVIPAGTPNVIDAFMRAYSPQ